MTGVWLAGDPHGDLRPVLRACERGAPGLLVLLGDQQLARPLSEELAPLLSKGWAVRWILGNHDSDEEAFLDRLWEGHPERDLTGGTVTHGDLTVAGLGGVFRGQVWWPQNDAGAVAVHRSRDDMVRATRRTDRWRGGVPRRHRTSAFPEDIYNLSRLRADVLVSHEAPKPHKYGFAGVNAAAIACGARLVVHGHHHRPEVYATEDGIQVRCLGIGEVWRCTI